MNFTESSIETLINIRKNICFTHNQPCGANEFFWENKNFWEMVYVEKGRAIKNENGKTETIGENELILCAPDEKFTIKPDNEMCDDVYYFSFVCDSCAMDFFRGFQKKISENSKGIMQKLITEGKRTYKILKRNEKISLVQSCEMEIGGQQMYKIYLELLLINLLREHSLFSQKNAYMPSKQTMYEEDVCREICDYLAENVYANVTIDDLRRKFNYCSTFLCSKFKKYKGVSIYQYYTALRISEACQLIKDGRYSVCEIAEMLNYSQPYSFSRAFKRVMGYSPQKYKEQLLEIV